MTAPQVALVGAGPGDPELLTRLAWRRLRTAEAVFHDGLVPDAILRIAKRARLVSVARRAGPKSITNDQVIAALTASALDGRRTVRLKAGDPFILGRGHDEAVGLAAAGIASEIIPGITAATSAPLLAGIPLTVRGLASGFLVISGHSADVYAPLLRSIAPESVTLVILMGIAQSRAISQLLRSAGWDAATPSAIITDASQPSQREWFGPLRDLSPDLAAGPGRPGVIVIGNTVACAVRSRQAVTVTLEHT